MQIIAVSTPSRPDWRWRIVSDAGEILEDSRQVYGSIASAMTDGRARGRELDTRAVKMQTDALRHRGAARARTKSARMLAR